MTDSTSTNQAQASSASSAPKSMDDIVALCRRRGFIWQSSEIYGGINGFWDYGPLGTELKRNLKEAWWQDVVRAPGKGPDGEMLSMIPVDCTIIMNPEVWVASGHVAGFNDPMVDDKETQKRFRADHLVGVYFRHEGTKDPTDPRQLPDDDSDDRMLLGAVVVASSLGEAVEIVCSNPKALPVDPSLGKRLIRVIRNSNLDRAQNLIYLDAEVGKENSYIALRPISLSRLKSNCDIVPSPITGKVGVLTEPRQFNLMYETYNGPIKSEDNKAYLRPETAQGIFCNFWNVVDTQRVKVPFGMAQVGKAFRNEVTPRNFTFRSREFEQMEIEFFIPDPEVVGRDKARVDEWYQYWRDARYAWWQSIGLAGDNLQLRDHEKEELAHYARHGAGVCDVEYRFPFTAPGFGELEGVAHRSNFDLKAHAEHCGKGDKMMYRDPVTNERYFPHVIEPSAGADRGALALICEAYTPDETRPSKVYMKFHPRMAPIKAGVFPLVNKDGMPEVAEKLYMQLRGKYPVQYDAKQSIGKRYARMDEAGTPYCFTVDGDTLTDNTVTVRDRDTAEQTRINLEQVESFLDEKMGG